MEIFYTKDEDELLKAVGCDRDKFWEYMSLDDWDYALVIKGEIRPKYLPERLLTGVCSNDWKYFPDENKTVGIAYHA